MVIRLKILINAKNNKLNTKNPQVKHCICPKCDKIYRSNLYNLQTRKKTAKKVTKN